MSNIFRQSISALIQGLLLFRQNFPALVGYAVLMTVPSFILPPGLILLAINSVLYIFCSAGIYIHLLKPQMPAQNINIKTILFFILLLIGIDSFFYLINLSVIRVLISISVFWAWLWTLCGWLYLISRFGLAPAFYLQNNSFSIHRFLEISRQSYVFWIFCGSFLSLPFFLLRYFTASEMVTCLSQTFELLFSACFYCAYLNRQG